MNNYPNHSRAGLSLVEVTVSSLLVGTIVVGSVSLLGASVRSFRVSSDLAKGPLLADALLAEIMSMPYHDPETASGNNSTNSGELSATRQDFDDIGDYNGWSTSSVQDRQGNVISDYAGWSRSVVVEWARRDSGNIHGTDTGLKRIIVTVTAPDGTETVRAGMRSRDGSLEQLPVIDENIIENIAIEISLGSSGASTIGSTNLINHIENPNG